jgi:hypothetical protein
MCHTERASVLGLKEKDLVKEMAMDLDLEMVLAY